MAQRTMALCDRYPEMRQLSFFDHLHGECHGHGDRDADHPADEAVGVAPAAVGQVGRGFGSLGGVGGR